MIAGSAPNDLLTERIRAGKLLIRYSERPYKKKASCSKRAYHFIKWRQNDAWKKTVYMLCASGYAISILLCGWKAIFTDGGRYSFNTSVFSRRSSRFIQPKVSTIVTAYGFAFASSATVSRNWSRVYPAVFTMLKNTLYPWSSAVSAKLTAADRSFL